MHVDTPVGANSSPPVALAAVPWELAFPTLPAAGCSSAAADVVASAPVAAASGPAHTYADVASVGETSPLHYNTSMAS